MWGGITYCILSTVSLTTVSCVADWLSRSHAKRPHLFSQSDRYTHTSTHTPYSKRQKQQSTVKSRRKLPTSTSKPHILTLCAFTTHTHPHTHHQQRGYSESLAFLPDILTALWPCNTEAATFLCGGAHLFHLQIKDHKEKNNDFLEQKKRLFRDRQQAITCTHCTCLLGFICLFVCLP